MGKFKAGESGNPKGRKPGRKNKITRDMKKVLHTLLDKEIDEIPTLLNELTPKEKLDVISKLIRFVVPLEKSVDLKATGDTKILIRSMIPEPDPPRPVELQKLPEKTQGQ